MTASPSANTLPLVVISAAATSRPVRSFWLRLALAVLVLGGASAAQVWSPHPLHKTMMGQGKQLHFGDFANGRFQFFDGNFRNRVLVILGVSIRPTKGYNYLPGHASGRTWTSVNIDGALTDIGKISQTYSANVLSSPTRCFSGAMTWPTLSGVQPNPLTSFPIAMPFTVPFIYIGTSGKDLLFDFQMTGGVLANQKRWFDHSPPPYITDGFHAGGYLHGERRMFANGSGCVDSGTGSQTAAAADMAATRFGKAYSPSQFADRLLVATRGMNLGRNAPHLNVVDFAVVPRGVPFGIGCENLYVQLTPAALFFRGTTTSLGYALPNDFGFPNGLQHQPAFNNVQIFSQYVWADTRTGALKLSSAAGAVVPHLLYDYAFEAQRQLVFGTGQGPTGRYAINPIYNPIFKYH